MTSKMRPHLVALFVLVILALAGCFRESDENTNEGTNPSPGSTAVEVLLTDEAIEMPDEVPAGGVLFEITNAGTTAHGFVIEGVDEAIHDLAPDQLDTVRTELEPGTYVVYSPVDDDRENGLERELTVTEAEGDGGAPLNDEAVGPSEEQDPVEDEDGG